MLRPNRSAIRPAISARPPTGGALPPDDQERTDHGDGNQIRVDQVACLHHTALSALVVDLRPGDGGRGHIQDALSQDASVPQPVATDALQTHAVEERLIPDHGPLEVVGAPPPQLRRNRVAEVEGDFLAGVEYLDVVDLAVSHPEVETAVLAEARGLASYDAVVRHDAPERDGGAHGDTCQGNQGLASKPPRQEHRQHHKVEDPLRPASDRRTTEHAR